MRALLDMVCPKECLLCEVLQPGSEEFFCPECMARLRSDFYRCRKCASPLPSVVPNHDCYRCRNRKWRFDSVVTLNTYRGVAKEVVIRMKKPQEHLLRRGVGQLLARQLTQELTIDSEWNHEQTLVLPVPNHWTHSLMGAADAAGGLARWIGESSGWTTNAKIIRRIRKTSKQGLMGWSERIENVRRAFKIGNAALVKGRHVILVDDVITTGATCGEIASCLKRAGAAQVTVAVAARGTGTQVETDSTAGVQAKDSEESAPGSLEWSAPNQESVNVTEELQSEKADFKTS